ncbi:DUF1615 domain-containing protein [Pseudorhodoferax sp.]|uniref:DUF1615 domain-containing protein n=1 Tax=Pseudorhodoferax sp. TaxID=1993553 RepID=UPI002DD68295|nr:DUF1615 domain-containing protein [Pseudorhodoferax sp.]
MALRWQALLPVLGVLALLTLLTLLSGCAGPQVAPRSPEQVQADIRGLLPASVPLRDAWAVDLQTVFAALQLDPSPAQVCAVIAITEQESTFVPDPVVPGLAGIARREIERRADGLGVPSLALTLALKLRSADGRSYDERLDAVRTEGELSALYEQFIDQVPLGERLFARLNPVRTGGAMQVSIAFAERQARLAPYPFPAPGSIRREVFTRRGGLYFGTAHLLAYPAPAYGSEMIYRFADFNAGRWASRNAAFQQALALASGRRLDLDGDLVVGSGGADATPGQTEAAARSLADALGMDVATIRRELERGDGPTFDSSPLLARVYALAERKSGKPQARARLPVIDLKSPKFTRKLTTEWFARRVDERWRRCLQRGAAGAG